jgi:hypothetical protein
MASEKNYQDRLLQFAALREQTMRKWSPQISENPRLAEVISDFLDQLYAKNADDDSSAPPPPDFGFAELAGIGPAAASALGQARIPIAVEPYDETVTSERIVAMADLYYIYQHEQLGVFRAITKLQQLFRAGAVRLSNGDGAYHLYQFDRRGLLRYTRRDRFAAYCRAFGYCAAPPPAGAKPNGEFHRLLTHFVRETALFWRDKRVSEVIRERSSDPSFGSIATVRRAGLDLRNNMKFTSYGHLTVLRVEVMQLLDEAFRVLGADDIKRLYGAEGPWDVIEEILTRYYNESLITSPRQRMAVAGREILRWIAQSHILKTARTEFESLLVDVAEFVEEWLTSAESIGVSEPRVTDGRVRAWQPRVVQNAG